MQGREFLKIQEQFVTCLTLRMISRAKPQITGTQKQYGGEMEREGEVGGWLCLMTPGFNKHIRCHV